MILIFGGGGGDVTVQNSDVMIDPVVQVLKLQWILLITIWLWSSYSFKTGISQYLHLPMVEKSNILGALKSALTTASIQLSYNLCKIYVPKTHGARENSTSLICLQFRLLKPWEQTS